MTEDERTHRRTMAALDKRTELLSRELLRRDVAAEHGLDPDRLPADADEDQLRHEAERISANDQLRDRAQRPRRAFSFGDDHVRRLRPGGTPSYADDGTVDMSARLRAARYRLP